MTDEFQKGDGTLSVRSVTGQYEVIATPAGFTDLVFRTVVAAADVAYRVLGMVPNVSQIQDFCPKVSLSTISEMVLTTSFRQAIAVRGVAWEDDSGLTLEQHTALLKLTDFTDRRSTSVKLKDIGVPFAKHQAWMRNALYAATYRKMTEDSLGSEAATLALNKLMGNVEAGDQRAIEKALEITGRYDPANKQLEDVRSLVTRLVEVVIRNVKDENVRRAILSDMRDVTSSYDLVSRSIER